MTQLHDLIAESRALRAELRVHLAARKSFARGFSTIVNATRHKTVGVEELRIVNMTSLLLEAYQIARRDEEGTTVDLIADALAHLDRRLEREVLPRFE